MFCPSCGKENSTEQKFCRACGLNLESSAMSLQEQRPADEHRELQRQERNLERFGTIAFAGLGVVIAAAIAAMIYAILANMILNGARPWFGTLLIVFLITAAMSLGYVIWREHLKEKRQKLQNTPAPEALPTPPTGKLLNESTIEPVSSVVEDTTRKLRIEKR